MYDMLTVEKRRTVLLDATMRSGKTYVSGSVIHRLFVEKNIKNVLFLSTTPKEQRDFVEKLREYVEFSEKNVNIVFLEASNRSRKPVTNKNLPTIYVTSEQFLREKTGRKCRKKACTSACACTCDGCKKTKETCECTRFQPVAWLKKEIIDLCLFDEVHHQGRTVLAHEALDTYTKDAIRVFLSGTADKVIQAYHITSEETLSWKTIDFEDMKRFDNSDVRLQMIERHGALFAKMICESSFSPAQLSAFYQELVPSLETIHIGLTERTYKKIRDFSSAYPEEKRGWSPQGMLLLNDVGNVFQAESHLLSYLQEIFGVWCSDGDEWYLSTSDTSMFSKIVSTLDTQKPLYDVPTVILTVLPTQIRNQTIAMTSNALKVLMETKNVFPQAHYVCVNSHDNGNEKPLDVVNHALNEAKRNGKQYVVVFVAYQLNIGATLKTCDVVVRMDNFEEQDRNNQINARCLTDDVERKKKVGVVLEANLSRSCHTILEYAMDDPRNTGRSPSESLEVVLKSRQFKVEYTIIKQAVDMILDISQKSILKSNYDRIKTLFFDVDKKDSVLFHSIFGVTKTTKKREAEILPGIVAEKIGEKTVSPPSSTNEKKKDVAVFNLVKEVVLYLLPVYCLLGLESPNKSFVGIHKYLQTTLFKDYLLQLFSIWKWKTDKDIFTQIELVYEKYLSKSTEFKCSFENILKSLSSCEDRSLLREWVDEHFMVHENEKKENAEVATPAQLRKEMLDVIPTEFWWSPKKVFEPCCGKGGFVLDIIDRFMVGLSSLIPDETERYRVIVEECLYVGDINPINIYITKLIVNPNGKYKINACLGDTLTLNIQSVFGVKRFDAVIGNPPYSTDPSKPSTLPLYNLFTEKYIGMCRYLLFVIPSRWFSGGKGLDKFRASMMARKDIRLITHIPDASSVFGKHVEIKGGVCYFLSDVTYNGKCCFNGVMTDLDEYDIIVEPQYLTILRHIYGKTSIDTLYKGRFFKIETNDKRLKGHGAVKCYVSILKSKDRRMYLDAYKFNDTNTFWKVITPRAAHGARSGFGESFIGTPTEIHTGSYISFSVGDEKEALSLVSYLKSKVANYMLAMRKISQDINEHTIKWIPLVPLDRTWTDEQVYRHFGFSSDEITIIEGNQ